MDEEESIMTENADELAAPATEGTDAASQARTSHDTTQEMKQSLVEQETEVAVDSKTSVGPAAGSHDTVEKVDTEPPPAEAEVDRSSAARSTTLKHSVCSASRAIPEHNPFKMPADKDIFHVRDQERETVVLEGKRQRQLKAVDKSTFHSRMNRKSTAVLRPSLTKLDSFGIEVEKTHNERLKEDQMFTLKVTRTRQREKESLHDYINKKREMFMVQYSLGVKREEMLKLEKIASVQEKKLELAERYLEEDAAMFDEFLKDNDKTSGDAIKIAEFETKVKSEKVAQIKRINAQIMTVRGDVSKYEDTLKEYQLYKKFLFSIAPVEWQNQMMVERQQKKIMRKALSMEESRSLSYTSAQSSDTDLRLSRLAGGLMENPEDDDFDETELYFSDPQQLLDIFAELEEQNLSLIQNSQETEEALEEMKQVAKNTRQQLEEETDVLNEQIEKLNHLIQKEEEKAKDLETKARMFSFGEFKSGEQERMLRELHSKVEEVYLSCIGDNEAKISTLEMLTTIETRLEELFAQIEMMPRDRIEAAEKTKEKERRLKMREEKIEEQKRLQEERLNRALERSKAQSTKRFGHPLVMRSEPPQQKKEEAEKVDQANREEEELAYYFQP